MNLATTEKQATSARDALNAHRRGLPMVKIDKDYVFEGPDGAASLLDLFEVRRRLLHGTSVFLREGDRVFHTYSTYARGTEQVGGTYYHLDMTALGRQEDWENSVR